MIQGSNTYYFIYNAHPACQRLLCRAQKPSLEFSIALFVNKRLSLSSQALAGRGDVTSLIDQNGEVVATYEYDEFGNITSSTGTIYNPLRYSGANNAYYDEETGFYKMGVRYYQSDVGRWLTRDEYLGSQEQPQTKNRYLYVENNPVKKIDPSGYMSIAKALSYSRKGSIIAMKNKLTDRFIPGYYSHIALDMGKTAGWRNKEYGEVTWNGLGDASKRQTFRMITNSRNVTRIAILTVRTSNSVRSRAVNNANVHIKRFIPYRLLSNVNWWWDGMNCTEFIHRSYYDASRGRIDFRPWYLRGVGQYAYGAILPDQISSSRHVKLRALGRR